jgi:hypothetical protein
VLALLTWDSPGNHCNKGTLGIPHAGIPHLSGPKANAGLDTNWPLFVSDLNQNRNVSTNFSDTKFNKNPFSISPVVTSGQTDMARFVFATFSCERTQKRHVCTCALVSSYLTTGHQFCVRKHVRTSNCVSSFPPRMGDTKQLISCLWTVSKQYFNSHNTVAIFRIQDEACLATVS